MNAPLLKSIEVRCGVQHAFSVFAENINAWWPPTHRVYKGGVVHLELEVGGRFYEQGPSGEESVRGAVKFIDAPHRIVYSWWPGAKLGPTEVQIDFVEQSDSTLVKVEHRMGDSQLGEAWPGRAQGFSAAWDEVLPALAAWLAGKS